MKISECSYCGMLAFKDKEVCANCEAALSTEENASAEIENYNFQPTPTFDSVLETPPTTQTTETFSQSSSFPQTAKDLRTPRQFVPRSNCLLCNRLIPASQKTCDKCANKKFPAAKIFAAFAVFAILAVLGGGAYAYQYFTKNSAKAFLVKYALATGSDKAANFESLSFKGKTDVSITVAPINKGLQAQSMKEYYSFEIIVQKSGKSLLEFFKNDPTDDLAKREVSYKQGFDGFNGWKYIKMFNQPPRLEETENDFESSKPEFFFNDYESVEFLNDEIKKEYGETNIEPLASISSFAVNGGIRISRSKVLIQVKKKSDTTLLVFDEDSSLLLGILKKDVINGNPVVATIFTDNYRPLTIKEKNSGETTVLLPNIWRFQMNQPNSGATKLQISMEMKLSIESIETDFPVDEKIFLKPISIYSVENKGF